MEVTTMYKGKILHKEEYYSTEQTKEIISRQLKKREERKRQKAKQKIKEMIIRLCGIIVIFSMFFVGKLFSNDPVDVGGHIVLGVTGILLARFPHLFI